MQIYFFHPEFEDQKVYLKDQLIAELEEKQKLIEAERHNMELTGDSMEMKPITTRKLRRRANEPSGNYNIENTFRNILYMNLKQFLLFFKASAEGKSYTYIIIYQISITSD